MTRPGRAERAMPVLSAVSSRTMNAGGCRLRRSPLRKLAPMTIGGVMWMCGRSSCAIVSLGCRRMPSCISAARCSIGRRWPSGKPAHIQNSRSNGLSRLAGKRWGAKLCCDLVLCPGKYERWFCNSPGFAVGSLEARGSQICVLPLLVRIFPHQGLACAPVSQ